MEKRRRFKDSRTRVTSWFRRTRWGWGHARPFSNPVPWLIAGVVLLLAYAWLPGLIGWYAALRYDLEDPQERTGETFHALVYDGAAQGAGRMDTRRFAEHLRSLKEAGFHPISLPDVVHLYKQGRRLPPRAVLVTVDGLSADRLGGWRRALVRSRFRGVLFVDPFVSRRPSWSALRRTQQLPHWDLGLLHGDLPIPGAAETTPDEDGIAVSFDSALRFERLHRLREASVAQHQRVRGEARRRLPQAPNAVALPRISADAENRAGIEVRRQVLTDTASAFFDIGFWQGGLSINTASADPLRINRLRVQPEWDGEMLVRILRSENALDFRVGASLAHMERASWIGVLGGPGVDSGGLRLAALPGQVGDGVWLAGSGQEGDFSLQTSFHHGGGVFRVLFMASPDEQYRWELRLSDRGDAELRRSQGLVTVLEARDAYVAHEGERHLSIRVRGNQAWVDIDGRQLFDGWVSLREQTDPGLVGFRVEGMDGRSGDVRIHSVGVSPPDVQVGIWSAPPERDAQALAWIGRHAGTLGILSPPLDRFSPSTGGGPRDMSREELFRTVSRLNRWELVPHMDVLRFRDLDRWTPDAIHEALSPLDCDGLLVRLDGREDWSLADLSAWVRRTAGLLQAQGRKLYLGLPGVISSRLTAVPPLAMIPGVQLVVGPEASATVRAVSATERRVPASELETELQQYFELVADRSEASRMGAREERRRIRDAAEAHFAVGEFEEAVTLWFDWHEQDPEHAIPLRRIGDALFRMGFRDEAIDFFQQSLERDPANLALAIEIVQMLDAEGESESSRKLLQTYAMLFPGDPSVLLAQAEWLFRRGSRADSLARVREVLAVRPDHLQAALLMAHLARTPEERSDAIGRLRRMGADEISRRQVLQTIRDADLLTLPEADPLVDLLLGLSALELDRDLQRMVAQMLPRAEAAHDDFSGESLAPGWIVDGGQTTLQPHRLRVRAVPGREEVLLRLAGSERWRDAFVEVEIEGSEGDFWIVLRRSRNNMVRYGFDETLGRMLLQIWERDGDQMSLKDYRIEPWTRPTGSFRMRLEVRGGGIVPLFNGRVWSSPPLPLPQHLTPGWVAVAAHSPEPGRAEMVLRSVSAGPLFPCIARLSDVSESGMEAQASRLRSLLGGLTALSPDWFRIGPDGAWVSHAANADHFHRMFARYHGLRLLPEVRVAAGASVRAPVLAEAAAMHSVDGFLLVLDQEPSAAWVRDLDMSLSGQSMDILLAYPDATGEGWRLRGLGRSGLLFPGGMASAPLQTVSETDTEAAAAIRERLPVWIRL